MAVTKKKLSKSAKEALKVLADSKLLNDKPNPNPNALPGEKHSGAANKNSAPNKMRPQKKRG